MAIRKYTKPATEEPKYKIIEECGTISINGKWAKKLNLISWNDATPKYDIRAWNDSEGKMQRGITLTGEELEELYNLIGKLMEEGDANDIVD